MGAVSGFRVGFFCDEQEVAEALQPVSEDEAGDGEGEGALAAEVAVEKAAVAAVGEDLSQDTAENDGPGFGDFGADVVGFDEFETGVGDEFAVVGHGGDAGEATVPAEGFEKVATLPGRGAVFGEPTGEDEAATGEHREGVYFGFWRMAAR